MKTGSNLMFFKRSLICASLFLVSYQSLYSQSLYVKKNNSYGNGKQFSLPSYAVAVFKDKFNVQHLDTTYRSYQIVIDSVHSDTFFFTDSYTSQHRTSVWSDFKSLKIKRDPLWAIAYTSLLISSGSLTFLGLPIGLILVHDYYAGFALILIGTASIPITAILLSQLHKTYYPYKHKIFGEK